MARKNDEVARLLGELAKLTEIDEGSPQAFRVRAYDNAQRAVEQLTRDVAEMSASELADVKGIGKSIAGRIREYVDTGSIDKLEQLRAKHPAGKLELMRVPGLGPKSVELLASELGVTDLDGLEPGELAAAHPALDRGVAELLDARQAVDRRTSSLGTASSSVREQLRRARSVARSNRRVGDEQ